MSDWTAAADEDVLAGIAHGDEVALGVLYDRYSRRAQGLAYRVLGDRGAAEEVVQESFVRIWRRADTFKPGRGSVERWLMAIVHHRAIDRVRAHPGRVRAEVSLDQVERVLQGDDPWNDVDRLLRREELERWLATLPDAQRRTLELAYFGGYTQSEIAAMTGAPLGTVKGRTRDALRKLRELPLAVLSRDTGGVHAPHPGMGESATGRS